MAETLYPGSEFASPLLFANAAEQVTRAIPQGIQLSTQIRQQMLNEQMAQERLALQARDEERLLADRATASYAPSAQAQGSLVGGGGSPGTPGPAQTASGASYAPASEDEILQMLVGEQARVDEQSIREDPIAALLRIDQPIPTGEPAQQAALFADNPWASTAARDPLAAMGLTGMTAEELSARQGAGRAGAAADVDPNEVDAFNRQLSVLLGAENRSRATAADEEVAAQEAAAQEAAQVAEQQRVDRTMTFLSEDPKMAKYSPEAIRAFSEMDPKVSAPILKDLGLDLRNLRTVGLGYSELGEKKAARKAEEETARETAVSVEDDEFRQEAQRIRAIYPDVMAAMDRGEVVEGHPMYEDSQKVHQLLADAQKRAERRGKQDIKPEKAGKAEAEPADANTLRAALVEKEVPMDRIEGMVVEAQRDKVLARAILNPRTKAEDFFSMIGRLRGGGGGVAADDWKGRALNAGVKEDGGKWTLPDDTPATEQQVKSAFGG